MKTKILIATALAASFTITTIQARIGETITAVEKRYGKPLESKHEGLIDSRRYSHGGLRVLVTFEKGVSRSEIYQNPKAVALRPSEIEGLLKANSRGEPWRGPTGGWKSRVYRASEDRVAVYNSVSHDLFVTTNQFLDRYSSIISAQDSAKMKEF